MASLTIQQGIIKKKGEDLTPERGFDLIIQEGQDYRFIPEDSPKQKKGLLSIFRRKKRKVFAISNHSSHRIASNKAIPHTDGIHSFYLDFWIDYRIGEDEEGKIRFVKKHALDPLSRVKLETGHTLAKYLKITDWNLLLDPREREKVKADAMEAFIPIGRGDSIQIFDHLNNFADEFGLTLLQVEFDVRIPEKHLAVRIKHEEFETEEKVKTRELRKDQVIENEEQRLRIDKTLNENELRGIERIEKIKDTLINSFENYVDQVGSNIAQESKTPEDALRDIRDLKRVMEVLNENLNNLIPGLIEGREDSSWDELSKGGKDSLPLKNLEEQGKVTSQLWNVIRSQLTVEELYQLTNKINLEITAKFKHGKVLYLIPSKMEFGNMSECIVRIVREGLGKKLIYGLSETQIKQAQIKEVELSPVVAIKIFEAPGQNMFDIADHYIEQALKVSDFTEWSFYLRPKKIGYGILIIHIIAKIPTGNFGIKDQVVFKLAHQINVMKEKNFTKSQEHSLSRTDWDESKSKEIKSLIGLGKTGEALTKLFNWSQDVNEEVENIIINFIGEWQRLITDDVHGIISREYKETQVNRINQRVMNFLADFR